jgi:sterol desaturase/sphingolipid hydroxylase (fatty acid hydroxylase superfamily)
MWTLLEAAGNAIARYDTHIFIGATFCLVLELAWPRSRYSLRSRIKAALFLFVYVAITASFFAGFFALWARAGIRPLLSINLAWLAEHGPWPIRVAGTLLGVLISVFVLEFFYYWYHRLQHSVPFLWRFHAVHHSIEELSGWNCYHHVTEEIFRIPFVTLPILMVVTVNPGYVPLWIPALTAAQGHFEHSCTRLHFGWLRYLISDNRYHRIHHSIEQRHVGKNFGAFTPIWDWLFGTALFPGQEEWPATGLTDVREPKTLKDYLMRPFKGLARLPRVEP